MCDGEGIMLTLVLPFDKVSVCRSSQRSNPAPYTYNITSVRTCLRTDSASMLSHWNSVAMQFIVVRHDHGTDWRVHVDVHHNLAVIQ